jgi:hypothetical protein
VDVVSSQVADFGVLKKLKDFQARKCGLQAHAFQVGGFAHWLRLIGGVRGAAFSVMIYRLARL